MTTSTFNWNTHEPTVFIETQAEQKRSDTATHNARQRKEFKTPKELIIHTPSKQRGRPVIKLDTVLLHKMREGGVTQEDCALFFGISIKTVVKALLGSHKKLRKQVSILNSTSRFNVQIANQTSTDRATKIRYSV